MTEELQKADPGEYKEQLKEAYLLAKEQLAECGRQNQRYDQKAVILLTINGTLGGLFAAYLKSGMEQSDLEPCQILALLFGGFTLLLLFGGLVWTLKVIGLKTFKQFELDDQFFANAKHFDSEQGIGDYYTCWIKQFTEYYQNNRKKVDQKAKELRWLFRLLLTACAATAVWGVVVVFSVLHP